MAIHYAVAGIRTLLTGTLLNAIQFPSPMIGSLVRIFISIASANSEGDTLFDVKKNGTSIYALPTSRPKILAGNTFVASVPLALVTVAENDKITIDLVSAPLGGITGLYVTVQLQDALDLRGTVIFTTGVLADQATANYAIPLMGQSWKLITAQADRACWVRGYVSAATRTADAGRLITVDASENVGLCAEIIFTASLLGPIQYGAPFPEGSNEDDALSLDGLFSVKNLSGSSHTITLTFLRLITER